jgi:hypothetical protein
VLGPESRLKMMAGELLRGGAECDGSQTSTAQSVASHKHNLAGHTFFST